MNATVKEKEAPAQEQQQINKPPAVVANVSLVRAFAARFKVDESKILPILKATAFKQSGRNAAEITNEQMAAMMIVCDQYGLNPFTKEIFAFPDKQNGIVPVVSVDGWNRIVNDHPQYDGVEFRYSDEIIEAGDARFKGLRYKAHEWIEAVFYRKDRGRPIVVREYFEEVYRPPFEFGDGGSKEGPWQSHDKRMHRHKAFIQGARLAFGFAGIYDEDEATRIIEVNPDAPGGTASAKPAAAPAPAATKNAGDRAAERVRAARAAAKDAEPVEQGALAGDLATAEAELKQAASENPGLKIDLAAAMAYLEQASSEAVADEVLDLARGQLTAEEYKALVDERNKKFPNVVE